MRSRSHFRVWVPGDSFVLCSLTFLTLRGTNAAAQNEEILDFVQNLDAPHKRRQWRGFLHSSRHRKRGHKCGLDGIRRFLRYHAENIADLLKLIARGTQMTKRTAWSRRPRADRRVRFGATGFLRETRKDMPAGGSKRPLSTGAGHQDAEAFHFSCIWFLVACEFVRDGCSPRRGCSLR